MPVVYAVAAQPLEHYSFSQHKELSKYRYFWTFRHVLIKIPRKLYIFLILWVTGFHINVSANYGVSALSLVPLEIALEGIRSSHERLSNGDLSPAEAIKEFSHVVARTVQARNQIRREYKRRTGRKLGNNWEGEMRRAGIADVKVAEFFHELRNSDVHEAPFVIAFEEETVFALRSKIGEVSHLKLRSGRVRATQSSTLFSDQHSPSVRLYEDQNDERPLEVISCTRRYKLEVTTDRLLKLLREIGTDDLVELTTRQIQAVEQYVRWFDGQYPSPDTA